MLKYIIHIYWAFSSKEKVANKDNMKKVYTALYMFVGFEYLSSQNSHPLF